MVLVKNVKILHPFCLGEIGKGKKFGDVLDRKQVTVDYKTTI